MAKKVIRKVVKPLTKKQQKIVTILKDAEERLIAILKNAIKNKGTFKPKQI